MKEQVVIPGMDSFAGSIEIPGLQFIAGKITTPAEIKALEAGDSPAGGYLVVDSALAELLRQEAKRSALRRIARILPDIGSGQSLLVPSEEAMLVDAVWTTELSIGSEETAKPYGERRLSPHPIAKWVKGSKLLFRTPHAYQWVLEQLAAAVAVPEENSFINGDGVGEPLGLLNAGLTATETAAATTLALGDVRAWRYALGAVYQPGATILCHPDFISACAALDTYGTFGLNTGRLLNVPVEFSDSFPSRGVNPASQTAGIVAVIGDFSNYWIVSSGDRTMARLVELFSETNQDVYILRESSDGMPVVKAAFRSLTITA